jgi:hypothetical protein
MDVGRPTQVIEKDLFYCEWNRLFDLIVKDYLTALGKEM